MAVIDSGDAFARILAASETRLAVVRRARAHLTTARRVQTAGGATALVAVATALLATDAPSTEQHSWVVVSLLAAAVGLAAVLVTQVAWARPLLRKVAMEEQVMLSDVDQLRELFIHTAQKEEWDDERIRETRQRLSQFPIEGETFR